MAKENVLEKGLKGALIALALAVAGVLAVSVVQILRQNSDSIYQVPHFQFETMDGKTYDSETLKGQPYLVNFWASWCEPCEEEIPELVRVYEKYKEQDLLILGVGVQDSEKNLRAFADKYGITFPIGLDEKGILSGLFGLTGVPETYFVSREGEVVFTYKGPLTEELLEAGLEKVL